MDRRGIFGDRRTAERREGPAFRPTDQDRRRGRDRRGAERRAEELEDRRRQHDRRRRPTHEPAASRHHIDWAALPPVSRLVPAAVVVAISLVDLGVSQTTSSGGWTFLVVLLAIPVAA